MFFQKSNTHHLNCWYSLKQILYLCKSINQLSLSDHLFSNGGICIFSTLKFRVNKDDLDWCSSAAVMSSSQIPSLYTISVSSLGGDRHQLLRQWRAMDGCMEMKELQMKQSYFQPNHISDNEINKGSYFKLVSSFYWIKTIFTKHF